MFRAQRCYDHPAGRTQPAPATTQSCGTTEAATKVGGSCGRSQQYTRVIEKISRQTHGAAQRVVVLRSPQTLRPGGLGTYPAAGGRDEGGSGSLSDPLLLPNKGRRSRGGVPAGGPWAGSGPVSALKVRPTEATRPYLGAVRGVVPICAPRGPESDGGGITPTAGDRHRWLGTDKHP